MNLEPIQLLILGLATYRLALLTSEEGGPYHAFSRFRSFLRQEAAKHPAIKRSDVAKGVSCIKCSSCWVALPIAAYAQWRTNLGFWTVVAGDGVLLAFALSAVAILVNRALPSK